MRRLVLTFGLAALLSSSAPAEVAAAAVQAPMLGTSSMLALGQEAAATTVQASKNKQSKSKKSKGDKSSSYRNNKVDATIAEIARAERGDDTVYVRILTTKPDMQCSMRVKFADASVAQPPRVMGDANGVCILHFDVPNRGSVVGPALMKVDIYNKRGQVRAKLVQDFAVFDRD